MPLLLISMLAFGCANPLEFNSNPQDIVDRLKTDPALQAYIDALAVPQDNRWHFSATLRTATDKDTGASGLMFVVKAKIAWPKADEPFIYEFEHDGQDHWIISYADQEQIGSDISGSTADE